MAWYQLKNPVFRYGLVSKINPVFRYYLVSMNKSSVPLWPNGEIGQLGLAASKAHKMPCQAILLYRMISLKG